MKSLFTRITGAVLTGVAAATLALSLSGCDKTERQTVINFSHTQAPNSVSDLAAQQFKKYVEEASNGKMRVEIFTNCGLSGGDLTKAIELTQTGNIDIHACAPANIANYDPRFYAFWLPFLFPTEDNLLKFCHSQKVKDEVNKWCNAIETENLGIHNAGSRQISNSKKEIKTPDDLIGMNIRVPGANVFISLYRTYFGANPTAMDFSEVYTSLQQGAIDGQENPIAVYASSKFDEVQKYVTLWDGVRDTTIWIMSSATLESLTDEEERIVRESADKALQWANDYLAESEGQIIADLKKKGVIFTELTEEEKNAFKEKCQGIYAEFEPSIGKDVIELFTKGYLED
ncbi:DctP family TRAP transporter solute-binding subunit [Succinatimonas hippei]|uniref:TRAP transporter solute receptor, DctP family n=1 Tax=Succinatimonas hippei (strain DSM 22608 / JCM 16073 / KCTC 15190 / YIT 12066) TaxID=762983 RepID=E8LLZ9_SUCHY|nr:DctP family TRAP transporter solute-binding subunit [Succinatimonas hippei]EFY06449.1 TRAP transporter solute receptor, DctP family [Succinatimonas hippei YIT 12066]MCL1604099.1 DctP family TRAP transporter solute-binding subunit [Succinatimonas hippei]MDM8120220.1 DctP family TRAP transporter solute-binding subunit [Succinatimonas hippei]